ncbi:related to ubiquitin-conjugating enzyme [Ustilago sp. UG-2017a]|uniref:Related to ubiquitin-conjugating enzyme n=1 Tax=Ustilago bromivora TaxID=307758 RepID=A0A1K0HFJ1_9BASI|nr:related to ubiquitin-conjugating enzyme [Ustilago bromivora]SOV07532.1 related to ubiquitin-conjugating enzyme [Ustilago sp. UG-2017a]SPC66610.1 related to ubiquitin-conjugating enzyme [Ustilago sp. UG-2017b]
MRIATKRLQKELSDLRLQGTPEGCAIIRADDLQEWQFSIEVLGNSLYQNEKFALRFRFTDSYPMESPEVVFIVTDGYKAPIHPHVYSNGHICASILGNEWSPVLNVSSVLITLQSMLASCKQLQTPPDNDAYVKRAPLSPKDSRFVYDDDTV